MEKSQRNSSALKGASPFAPNPLDHGGYSDRFFRRELGEEGTFENLEGPHALVPVFLKVIVSAIESSCKSNKMLSIFFSYSQILL